MCFNTQPGENSTQLGFAKRYDKGHDFRLLTKSTEDTLLQVWDTATRKQKEKLNSLTPLNGPVAHSEAVVSSVEA